MDIKKCEIMREKNIQKYLKGWVSVSREQVRLEKTYRFFSINFDDYVAS